MYLSAEKVEHYDLGRTRVRLADGSCQDVDSIPPLRGPLMTRAVAAIRELRRSVGETRLDEQELHVRSVHSD